MGAQWTAGPRSGRMRVHALSSRATSQMCSAQSGALWCLSDTMSALLCSRPTPNPSNAMQASPATSRQTSDLFSLSDSIISIIRGLETYQYWQTRVYCLVFAKKFCHNQGSVFTPNYENSIQWNKLCYFHK